MKKLLYILLLIPCFVSAQSRYNINQLPIDQKEYWLKETVGAGGASLAMGSSTYGTDRTASIQALLNLAGANTKLLIHWDDAYVITAKLHISSNTTIDFRPGCGAIAGSGLNANMFENYHPTASTNHIDSNIVLTGRNWIVNGNGRNQSHDGLQGWVTPIRFTGVDNITIENGSIIVPSTFHCWLMNDNNIHITNMLCDWGNTTVNHATQYANYDGFHFNGPCRYIYMHDNRFKCFDDNIAFNANDVFQNTDSTQITPTFTHGYASWDRYATHGKISDFIIDGVQFMPNDLFGLRFLSTADSIVRGKVTNVYGKTGLQAMIIDNWFDGSPSVAGFGYFGDIVFDNISAEVIPAGSYTYKQCYFALAGVFKNVTFSNIKRRDYSNSGYPTFLIETPGVTKASDISIKGFADTGYVALPSISVYGQMGLLSIEGYKGVTNTSHPDHPLLKMYTGGAIPRLKYGLSDTKYIDNVIDNSSGGQIDTLSIYGVTHTGVLAGQGLIKMGGGKTIKYLNASNVVSALITSNGGTYTTQSGDYFTPTTIITSLTGDVTTTGSGAAVATVVHAPASGITGTTLASVVTGSSLTSVGTLAGLTVNSSSNPSFTTTASSTAPIIASFLAPNTATSSSAGQGAYVPFGVALSTNNAGVAQLHYVGSGSTSNSLDFSLYGNPSMVHFYVGNMGIGTSSPPNSMLGISGGTSSISALNIASQVNKTSSLVNGDFFNVSGVFKFYDGSITERIASFADGTPANGELLIGNAAGWTKSTLTAGLGVQIANTSGTVTISAAPVAVSNVTAQTTAGNLSIYTVGAATGTFNISSYLNVTAIGVDVIQIQVTYTDENSASQTVSLSTLSAIGNSSYSPVTIRAKNGTAITVKTNLTVGGGTVTYDAGSAIMQLN